MNETAKQSHESRNQSLINQPIKQTRNQANQSTDQQPNEAQSINRSTSQPINHSMYRIKANLTKPTFMQQSNHSIKQSANESNQPANQSTNQTG